jgi:hypothetical protein
MAALRVILAVLLVQAAAVEVAELSGQTALERAAGVVALPGRFATAPTKNGGQMALSMGEGDGVAPARSETLSKTVKKLVNCFMDATPKCLKGAQEEKEPDEGSLQNEVVQLQHDVLQTNEENAKLKREVEATKAQATKAERQAQDEMDAAKAMKEAAKSLVGLPVEVAALRAGNQASNKTLAAMSSQLDDAMDTKQKAEAEIAKAREETEAKLLSLKTGLSNSQSKCRAEVSRAQKNADNAIHAISTAEAHAEGLAAQMEELRMEHIEAIEKIVDLKSSINATVSSDAQAETNWDSKMRGLLKQLQATNNKIRENRGVREISEKLEAETRLRHAEKQRSFELTEKLLATGKAEATGAPVKKLENGKDIVDTRGESYGNVSEVSAQLEKQTEAKAQVKQETREIDEKVEEIREAQHAKANSIEELKNQTKELGVKLSKYKLEAIDKSAAVKKETRKSVGLQALANELQQKVNTNANCVPTSAPTKSPDGAPAPAPAPAGAPAPDGAPAPAPAPAGAPGPNGAPAPAPASGDAENAHGGLEPDGSPSATPEAPPPVSPGPPAIAPPPPPKVVYVPVPSPPKVVTVPSPPQVVPVPVAVPGPPGPPVAVPVPVPVPVPAVVPPAPPVPAVVPAPVPAVVPAPVPGTVPAPAPPAEDECNYQCYIDRYPELKSVFGITNTDAAKEHYLSFGKAQNRDCTCPKATALL